MASLVTFGGGMLLGLASSLHCIGMCGALTAVSFSQPQASSALSVRSVALFNAGRIAGYTLLGAIASGLLALAGTVADPAMAHDGLRIAGALTLVWVGAALVTPLPSPAHLVGRLHLHAAHQPRPGLPLALAGMAWGLAPCGPVIGALLYAGFAGSSWAGAAVMLGFGLGTLPAMLAIAGAGRWARQMALTAQWRWPLAGAMVAAGLGSLLLPVAAIRAMCGF